LDNKREIIHTNAYVAKFAEVVVGDDDKKT